MAPSTIVALAACVTLGPAAWLASNAALASPVRPVEPTSSLAPAGQPDLVQPESLAQGFILVVTDKQNIATSDSPIFIASNHNGWSPSDQNQKLTPRSDRRWQIIFPKPKLDSRMAFKFTRGSWDNVEVDANYGDVENRSLPKIDASKLKPGEVPIIELTIAAFKDKRPASLTDNSSDPYREIKASGTIRRIEVVGGGVPITRDLIVWLPPGYDDAANATRRYPVLYLNDGQNVFEKLPTIPDEWQADETAAKLIASAEIEPLIIVGIPHGGAARAIEYVPTPVFDNTPARGAEYTSFLVNEVVPRVDRSLRTKPGAENRAIGGSSLGGLISLYAASRHPDVFGKVLAESSSLAIRGTSMSSLFDSVKAWPSRVYMGVGTREMANRPADSDENRSYVQASRDLVDVIEKAGAGRTKLVVETDANHTESAWAKRLPDALKYLFPPAK